MSKVDWGIVAIASSGGDIEKARQWFLDRGMTEDLAKFDADCAASAARARRAQEAMARLYANPVCVLAGSTEDVRSCGVRYDDEGARWAFEERAAILEFEGGVSRVDAERRARHMASALALLERREEDRVIAGWRDGIGAVAAAGMSWDTLRAASLAFLAGPHARAAVRLRWPLHELWGVFSGDPVDIPFRRDAWGLVSGMALSSFSYRIVEISGDRAVLETRSGGRHQILRKTFMSESVAWWRHPALVRA